MQISDVILLSRQEIHDLIVDYRSAIALITLKLESLNNSSYTVLSQEGITMLQKQRQDMYIRLGALLKERYRRRSKHHAQRKSSTTVIPPAPTTGGTTKH